MHLDKQLYMMASYHVQVWSHALQFTAEVMLEGLARAGAKSRCTMMGRAAMSLDLQVCPVLHGCAACKQSMWFE